MSSIWAQRLIHQPSHFLPNSRFVHTPSIAVAFSATDWGFALDLNGPETGLAREEQYRVTVE